jgi:hypothetical protein
MPSNASKRTASASSKKSASKPGAALKGRSSAARKGARGPRATAAKGASSPLMRELTALLGELDDEGLAFLLEQAKVHRYNMEVEKLNAISERLASEGTPEVPAAARSAIRLERSKDGSTYHIVAGSSWKMFTAEEIAALVRIARSDDTESERAKRTRSWFARERKDVLVDLGMDGPSIGLALEIVRLLRKTFPPRS